MAVTVPAADREQLPVRLPPLGHLFLSYVLELNPITSIHFYPLLPYWNLWVSAQEGDQQELHLSD